PGGLAKVKAAVIRTLQLPLTDWRLEPERKINEDTYLIAATDTALGSRRRRCMVLVSRVQAGEVEVYAKFWEYLLESSFSISLNGQQSGPKYVPVHPNYYRSNRPEIAQNRRK